MIIARSFDIDQPVDKVWEFFDDVPLVAACVPGADLTNKIAGDHYQGDVVISAGPVKLEFTGELKITSRDEVKKALVLDGVGADKKGRGNASTVLDVTLQPMGGASTRVNIAMDLQISGAAAQYGRGLVQDVTGVLIDQTAGSMKVRMQALAQGQDPYAVGEPKAASGIAIGLTAFMRAVKRVFGRFFLPYKPAPSR
ncbi:MAG: carbon monoxide dehydrogenase [Actinobacteria bacterium]|nr:carbon monoxide dehydrogenase [Actinomycetota bacterium]